MKTSFGSNLIFYGLIILFNFNSACAQSGNFNLRLGSPNAIIEYGSSKFGIGLTFNFLTESQEIEGLDFKYLLKRGGGRISYYSSDFGKDGFYFAIEGGIENRLNKGQNSTTQENFEGVVNCSYAASHVGYSWFWPSINFSIGGGIFAKSDPSYQLMGSKGSTIIAPPSNRILPSLDISIGQIF